MYSFRGCIVNTHLNVNKYLVHCEYYIGGDSMSGGELLITFFTILLDFDKMSVSFDTRHNPFPHFLPHKSTTIYHHYSPCCYSETKKTPLVIVLEVFFYVYVFSRQKLH
jgi:hypothetical protein